MGLDNLDGAYGIEGQWRRFGRMTVAGFNSTPALISMILFVTYSQVLNVSAARSTIKQDKKGRVSCMKNVKVKVSGRMTALLAPACAALAGLTGLSGGSG